MITGCSRVVAACRCGCRGSDGSRNEGGRVEEGCLVTHMRTHTVLRMRVDVRDVVLNLLHPTSPPQGVLDGREVAEYGEDSSLL